VSGVVGNTAANGIWMITVVDANNFKLIDSEVNSTYTSSSSAIVGVFAGFH
jgi:hypothetical protein